MCAKGLQKMSLHTGQQRTQIKGENGDMTLLEWQQINL